jgi:hypothetical protein
MKRINKYFMLFAAVAFMFTACEKEIVRDPSPVAPSDAISFAQGSKVFEINPNKQALELDVEILRGNSAEAQEVVINIDSADNVFSIPEKVSFAAGESSAKLHITFPKAEVGNTYTFALSISEDKQSSYLSGATTFAGTVSIAEWEQASAKAVLFDGIVITYFGVDYVGWYVNYQFKNNADGSRDIRLLNPYGGVATDEDDFGIFDAYPYNEAGNLLDGSFPWDIHINADNTVSYTRVEFGIDYGYGTFFSRMLSDADGNPAYGTFDPETNSITFAAGSVSSGMGESYERYSGEDIVIYLDDQQYRDANLSVGDFNSSSIKWNEVETAVNIFSSELFNFESENQKLFTAEDAYAGNPNSPFINLYSLKDLYSQGTNLAFYWDKETNEISVPAGQFTGLTVAGKKIVIAEAEGIVSVDNVKGTDVTTLTFNIVVASESGDLVGEFTETFTFASQPIVFEKADFLGSFNLNGYDLWKGALTPQPVEIVEDGDNLLVLGVNLADTLVAGFDATTGVMTIAPQAVDSIPYNGTMLDGNFFTVAGGSFSSKATLSFAFKLNGLLALTNDSEATGYAIYTTMGGGAFDGYDGLWFERPSEEEVVEGARRRNMQMRTDAVKSAKVKGNKPSVENIKFTNKNVYRTLRTDKKF